MSKLQFHNSLRSQAQEEQREGAQVKSLLIGHASRQRKLSALKGGFLPPKKSSHECQYKKRLSLSLPRYDLEDFPTRRLRSDPRLCFFCHLPLIKEALSYLTWQPIS